LLLLGICSGPFYHRGGEGGGGDPRGDTEKSVKNLKKKRQHPKEKRRDRCNRIPILHIGRTPDLMIPRDENRVLKNHLNLKHKAKRGTDTPYIGQIVIETLKVAWGGVGIVLWRDSRDTGAKGGKAGEYTYHYTGYSQHQRAMTGNFAPLWVGSRSTDTEWSQPAVVIKSRRRIE